MTGDEAVSNERGSLWEAKGDGKGKIILKLFKVCVV
jgi:hypothetical protein